ncbi:hypothetical protein, partial [Streptosporangium subroseum]|uniref:hypothetical protein n=1 Tax=Streptosporangium subroseum TaxID=106412 RepID=UPI0015C61250
ARSFHREHSFAQPVERESFTLLRRVRLFDERVLPSKGKLIKTPEGRAFLLPARWKANHEAGASGGMTCARPKSYKDCTEGGVEIIYGFTPDVEYFNLDDTNQILQMFCGDDGRTGFLLERELRRNKYHEAEYRKYRIDCTGEDFEAQTWYFAGGNNLIKISRVPQAEADSIVDSFDLFPD